MKRGRRKKRDTEGRTIGGRGGGWACTFVLFSYPADDREEGKGGMKRGRGKEGERGGGREGWRWRK